jgi:hypothetical protein
VQPDPVEEQAEIVQTTEVADEAAPVEDTAEVAETAEEKK